MSRKVKTEEERLQMRTLILDAARNLFVERGVEATSMREIARQINYSATTLYHHFADKDALLQALCDTDFLALASSMREIMQIPDLIQRIRAFAQSYAHFALQYPNHYRLMFMTPRAPCNQEMTQIEKGNADQDGYAQLQAVVQAAFDADLFREELQDCELIAQTLWASMHGVCSLQISMGNETWMQWADIEDRLSLMQNAVLRGLLRQPERI